MTKLSPTRSDKATALRLRPDSRHLSYYNIFSMKVIYLVDQSIPMLNFRPNNQRKAKWPGTRCYGDLTESHESS